MCKSDVLNRIGGDNVQKEINMLLTKEEFEKRILKYLIIILSCLFVMYVVRKFNIDWLGSHYYSFVDGFKMMTCDVFLHEHSDGVNIFIKCLFRYAIATYILVFGSSSILLGTISTLAIAYKKMKSKNYKYSIFLTTIIIGFILLTYFYIAQLSLFLIIIGEFIEILKVVAIGLILGLILMVIMSGRLFF